MRAHWRAWLDGKFTLLMCAAPRRVVGHARKAACGRTRHGTSTRPRGRPGKEVRRAPRSAAARAALSRSHGRFSAGPVPKLTSAHSGLYIFPKPGQNFDIARQARPADHKRRAPLILIPPSTQAGAADRETVAQLPIGLPIRAFQTTAAGTPMMSPSARAAITSASTRT